MGLVKMGENPRKCKVSAGSVCEMTKDRVIFQPILWTDVSLVAIRLRLQQLFSNF